MRITEWKKQVGQYASIHVVHKVKDIHPVVDEIVRNLARLDCIRHIRITNDQIEASNAIEAIGRVKKPITKPDHPVGIGISLILDFPIKTIQFYEITSVRKGCGEKMVHAVLEALPIEWEAAVVMDWSGGFWKNMAAKYNQIIIF